jgi:oligopeptide/dipeptide ABC transporter ATP-binding protein
MGREITHLTPREMKPLRKEMQVIFQDPYGSLNPRMTVGQSIEEGLRNFRERGGGWKRSRVRELLSMVGMPPNVGDRYPHEFSGGQRQRIGIARALSVEPSLIVCDEPVSALDVSIQAQIINLLMELRRRLGLTYLFIAHDLNVVQYVSDTLAVMYRGQIMEYGPSEAIYDEPVHPYTRELLAAAATPDPARRKRPVSEVSPETTDVVPAGGCKFSAKCREAEEKCRAAPAPFVALSDGRSVRCWKAA